MDFLGIGPFEIALVVLIAFIVLGPERIPGAMRQLGQWVRQLREFANNVTRDYGTDIQQLTGEVTALQEELRSIQRELGQAATGFMTTTLPSDQDKSIAPKSMPPIESTPKPIPASPAPAEPIAPSPDPNSSGASDTYTI